MAPLWCDLGFFPYSSGNKASANLSPTYSASYAPLLCYFLVDAPSLYDSYILDILAVEQFVLIVCYNTNTNICKYLNICKYFHKYL